MTVNGFHDKMNQAAVFQASGDDKGIANRDLVGGHIDDHIAFKSNRRLPSHQAPVAFA